MDLQLQHKKALIAASTSGIGFAVAAELLKEGAHVMICGRNQHRLDAAVKELKTHVKGKGKIAGLCADISKNAEIENLVTTATATLDGLDILITNAGGPPSGPFAVSKDEDWETAFHLTLMSAVNLIRSALPYLRESKSASILTLTSVSAKQPLPGLLMSNIFRPALLGLTKNLAQELGPDNIRVNSLLPGWTATEHLMEMLTSRADNLNVPFDEEMAKINKKIPLRRMGSPEEIAKVAAFMVSAAASYMTGNMVQVDGGFSVGLF